MNGGSSVWINHSPTRCLPLICKLKPNSNWRIVSWLHQVPTYCLLRCDWIFGSGQTILYGPSHLVKILRYCDILKARSISRTELQLSSMSVASFACPVRSNKHRSASTKSKSNIISSFAKSTSTAWPPRKACSSILTISKLNNNGELRHHWQISLVTSNISILHGVKQPGLCDYNARSRFTNFSSDEEYWIALFGRLSRKSSSGREELRSTGNSVSTT